MKQFLPVIVPIDGADESGLTAARNGGHLRLEGDSVAAYAGGPSVRIGYVRCREIRAHLNAGGSAYFRHCDGQGRPNLLVCVQD
jgi:hypothetical protein